MPIKIHVLLRFANELETANDFCHEILTDEVIHEIVGLIPDEWASVAEEGLSSDEVREVYYQFLTRRIAQSETFLNQARHALHPQTN